MLVFVCLTNILLITSLISLLSASLSRVSHVTCLSKRRKVNRLADSSLLRTGSGALSR